MFFLHETKTPIHSPQHTLIKKKQCRNKRKKHLSRVCLASIKLKKSTYSHHTSQTITLVAHSCKPSAFVHYTIPNMNDLIENIHRVHVSRSVALNRQQHQKYKAYRYIYITHTQTHFPINLDDTTQHSMHTATTLKSHNNPNTRKIYYI